MSHLEDILKPNEEILWIRIKVKNLVLNYPAYIIIVIFTIFFIYAFIYSGILALTNNLIFFGSILIITGTVLEILFIFSMIFIFRKYHSWYRKITEVSNKELKEYKIIYAISNQRIIIKDLRDLRFVKNYVEKNSISNIEFEKDYVFLYLKNIEAILFRKDYYQIRFLLDKTKINRLIYFDFNYYPRSEAVLKMNEVKETLNKNFILEKYFENEFEIKYNFSLYKKSIMI